MQKRESVNVDGGSERLGNVILGHFDRLREIVTECRKCGNGSRKEATRTMHGFYGKARRVKSINLLIMAKKVARVKFSRKMTALKKSGTAEARVNFRGGSRHRVKISYRTAENDLGFRNVWRDNGSQGKKTVHHGEAKRIRDRISPGGSGKNRI